MPELGLAGQGRDALLQIQRVHPLGIGCNFAINPGQLLREFPGKRQALSAQPPLPGRVWDAAGKAVLDQWRAGRARD